MHILPENVRGGEWIDEGLKSGANSASGNAGRFVI
jgi:hypothetical protein